MKVEKRRGMKYCKKEGGRILRVLNRKKIEWEKRLKKAGR
jgi:hypothetical protein